MKIKTPNQVHDFTDIREKTSKIIWGYYNDYFIQIEKADKLHQTKEKTVWSVDCTAPDGCYIYNGYFTGTMKEALVDVFRNIELP